MLLIIVVAGFTYVGFGMFSYYKKRNKFFSSMTYFLDKVRADINFTAKNLSAIIGDKKDVCDSGVKKLENNFLEYLKDKNVELDQSHLFKGITFLKPDEKSLILDFCSNLGRRDVENEIMLIDNFKVFISERVVSTKEEFEKNGKMCLKLSFLLGLVVAILLI